MLMVFDAKKWEHLSLTIKTQDDLISGVCRKKETLQVWNGNFRAHHSDLSDDFKLYNITKN